MLDARSPAAHIHGNPSIRVTSVTLACHLQHRAHRQSTPIAIFTTKAPCALRFSTGENRASFFAFRKRNMASSSVKSVCPYCGVGCGIVMQVEHNRVIKVTGDKTHPSNFGRLCTKGTTCGEAIAESGRMESAYVRHQRSDEPVRTDIDAAVSETARRLRTILDRDGPGALAFYVSGQMSLEAQ